MFTLKTQIGTIEKKRDYENFLISGWFIKFKHKNKRKLDKKFENSTLLKNSVN